MSREVEKWVTIGGRRIPIFKKDGIKPINKKELAKKIYKAADGTYTLDLPKGYRTVYGTDYIQYKNKASVKYDLENNVTTMSANPEYQKTIKGFKRPEGKPELRAYGRNEAGQFRQYTFDDYKTKSDFERDLRANGIKNIHIKDKRDDYIITHTDDYKGMNDIVKDYRRYRRFEKEAKADNSGTETLWKEKADELKQIIDKANKVYLQKQKKYKIKK